jgi:hypothetical protein
MRNGAGKNTTEIDRKIHKEAQKLALDAIAKEGGFIAGLPAEELGVLLAEWCRCCDDRSF